MRTGRSEQAKQGTRPRANALFTNSPTRWLVFSWTSIPRGCMPACPPSPRAANHGRNPLGTLVCKQQFLAHERGSERKSPNCVTKRCQPGGFSERRMAGMIAGLLCCQPPLPLPVVGSAVSLPPLFRPRLANRPSACPSDDNALGERPGGSACSRQLRVGLKAVPRFRLDAAGPQRLRVWLGASVNCFGKSKCLFPRC